MLDDSGAFRSEQGELCKLTEDLLRQFGLVASTSLTGGFGPHFNLDLLSYAKKQCDLIASVRQLVETHEYFAALVCIRTSFEAYFRLRLLCVAEVYGEMVKGDGSNIPLEDQFKSWLNTLSADDRARVIGFKRHKGVWFIIRRDPAYPPAAGDTVLLPVQYSVWRTFDPESAYLPEVMNAPRFWYDDKDLTEWDSLLDADRNTHKSFLKSFVSFDAVLFQCEVNGFLSASERQRVDSHYNYLSRFSHAIGKLDEDLPAGLRYDRYVAHCLLLYCAYLSVMYLESIHRMIDITSSYSANLTDMRISFERARSELLSKFGYFWFIYHGRPSDITKFHRSKEGCIGPGWQYVQWERMPDDDVRYYTNPINHLREQRGQWRDSHGTSVVGPLAHWSDD